MNVTGLCLTDVHFAMGDWKFPKMSKLNVRCPGHEGAGVIVKVGELVKNCKVGQRAAYGPTHSSCGNCSSCRTGKIQYCPGAIYTGGTCDGKYKIILADTASEYLGSYKQYCSIPESSIIVSSTKPLTDSRY